MSLTATMTIRQIGEQLQQNPTDQFIYECVTDSRQGVRVLGIKYEKLKKAQEEEQTRIDRLLSEESRLRKEGFTLIGGIDEAGRGPLAGPVVAAVCILPEKINLPFLNDSKQLSEGRREKLFIQIQKEAIDFAIGRAEVEEIDNINILQATKLAMRRAVGGLKQSPDYLLIDALELADLAVPQKGLIRGDSLSASIAAASILAKVTRDHWMNEIHALYPQYGFDRHKGYGTGSHLQALKEFGPSPIHRRSFSPVSEYLHL